MEEFDEEKTGDCAGGVGLRLSSSLVLTAFLSSTTAVVTAAAAAYPLALSHESEHPEAVSLGIDIINTHLSYV